MFRGEWGGERESPNVADGFVGNARLRDTSRGTGVGRARRRLDVRNEWGSGHRWRLADSANQVLSPGVFYPAIYAEDGEDGSPYPSRPTRGPWHLACTRVVSTLRPVCARSPCASVGAGEDTLVSGSVGVARVSLSTGQDRKVSERVFSVTRVSLSYFQEIYESALAFARFRTSVFEPPAGIHSALLRTAVRAGVRASSIVNVYVCVCVTERRRRMRCCRML